MTDAMAWMHVDDHNGGFWLTEAEWHAWVETTPRDQEIMPLLGVQFDDVYVSAEDSRRFAETSKGESR